MTKPLQGAKFRKFRDLIMGVNAKFGATKQEAATPQECVGEQREIKGQRTDRR